MIREAQIEDVERCIEMGNNFIFATSYRNHIGPDGTSMKKLAEDLIGKKSLLVSERQGKLVGMLGYIVYSHFISGQTIAGEIFWWVEPEYRGEGVKLLREVEKRARLAGAKDMQMIAPTDQVGRVYQRLGYDFVESTYQRAL